MRDRVVALLVAAVVVAAAACTEVPAAFGLPDGRVYELVSSLHNDGSEAGVTNRMEPAYSVATAADGKGSAGVLFGVAGPLDETESGTEAFAVAYRAPTEWRTQAAIVPRPPRSRGTFIDSLDGFMPSSGLSRVLFTMPGTYAVGNPNNLNQSVSIYLSDSERVQWIGRPSEAIAPDPPLGDVKYVARLQIAGGSPDLSTDYFTYYGTLVPEDESRAQVLAEHGGANEFIRDWGFYEWREGEGLHNAGELPPGSQQGPFDPDGAVPAATINSGGSHPDEYGNQVSGDGSRAFFVSPDPTAESGRPVELYLRVSAPDGQHESVLVSRSELEGSPGQPAPTGVLAVRDPQNTAGESSYVFASPDGSTAFFVSKDRLTGSAPAGEGEKEYAFDLATRTVRYLPGVTAPLLASSSDGSSFVYTNTAETGRELKLWSDGEIASIENLTGSPTVKTVGPVRIDGSTIVFQTNALVAGANSGGFQQVYAYDTASKHLSCVSCPPVGVAPSGNAVLSNSDVYRYPEPVDNRGVSSDGGRVFFDSPDPLVPTDVNGRRDVYEWESGSLSLISSGTGATDSFFLDNTATGNDVFFTTADNLTTPDTDGGYDVYDARVGGGFPRRVEATSCAGSTCQEPAASPLTAIPEGSMVYAGAGNLRAPVTGGNGVKAKKRKKRARHRARSHARRGAGRRRS